MTEPLIEQSENPAEKAARLLDEMAARIRLNKDDVLGGAFVVIPPKDGGDPFTYLGLDSMQDAVLFYQLLNSRIKAVLEQIDAQQRQGVMRR